ncbi:MAG: NUDIX domain-containing protein, partial [Candidatus Micrarchaeaceae archaeon]
MQAVVDKRGVGKLKKEIAQGIRRGEAVAATKRSFACYVFNGDEMLMLKTSDNKWRAVCDEIAAGESPEQAAVRKVYELTGIVIDSLTLMGELFIVYEQNSDANRLVFVLYSREFSGSKKESENIAWVSKQEAFERHDKTDKLWLPLLLSEKRFRGEFYFDSPSSNKLIKYKI